ncbi:outer membrane lipoprotein carrier protein LolA, partial [Pseudomonas marginalis]
MGAGLPAMVVNENAGHLDHCSAWAFFAGKPAPT